MSNALGQEYFLPITNKRHGVKTPRVLYLIYERNSPGAGQEIHVGRVESDDVYLEPSSRAR